VLACGPGAALARLCAGALWEIWERAVPARPQVCVPTGSGRRGPRGIEIHRTALDRAEVTERYGIPVTSLPRTLLDLAGVLDARRLRSTIRQAERVHRLDLRTLRRSVEAPRNSVKHARLRRALDAYVPGAASTEADAEMAFLELCSRRRLPAPECQVPIGRWRADLVWARRGSRRGDRRPPVARRLRRVPGRPSARPRDEGARPGGAAVHASRGAEHSSRRRTRGGRRAREAPGAACGRPRPVGFRGPA
jgi:hypothetical protein